MSISKNVKRLALYMPSLRGGGAERVMLILAGYLAEKGFNVDLVLSKAEGPYMTSVPPGIRIIDLNSSRVLLSLPRLVRYIRRERPLSLISTLRHANIVAMWAKKMSRVPVRIIIRESNTFSRSTPCGPTLRERMLPLVMRRFYPSADQAVAVSKGVASDLINVIKLPEEKVSVIYNPSVTPDIFEKAEANTGHAWFGPGKPPVILGVGRLSAQKDFFTLIRAFAAVDKKVDSRLIILGEGEDRTSLEMLIKELRLKDKAQLPGFVDNPFAYMKNSAVFVLSSHWEGLPNVMIQAMAVGTPVVSTDCHSGPSEILEGGRYGPLTPVGDPEALAEGILRVIKDPPDRDLLKVRASHFSLENNCNRYLEVLLGDSAK